MHLLNMQVDQRLDLASIKPETYGNGRWQAMRNKNPFASSLTRQNLGGSSRTCPLLETVPLTSHPLRLALACYIKPWIDVNLPVRLVGHHVLHSSRMVILRAFNSALTLIGRGTCATPSEHGSWCKLCYAATPCFAQSFGVLSLPDCAPNSACMTSSNFTISSSGKLQVWLPQHCGVAWQQQTIGKHRSQKRSEAN